MLPFRLVYSDGYYLELGAHVFPGQKYRLIQQHLLEQKVADAQDFVTPEPARDEDVLRVHERDYVEKLLAGTLSAMDEARMEVPFSPELRRAFWLAAGGSILAARHALADGVAFNIGGGFHHAFPDHGEGFCMIHDVAIAIRKMQSEGRLQRAMTVDCDVHHGNGTAAIFPPRERGAAPLPSNFAAGADVGRHAASDAGAENEVFTISLHQENNYPMCKPRSAIDVNLPDGTDDEQYLGWLDQALSSGLRQFSPELICYIAGADPYREDQLGGLNLSIEGLKRRDALLFSVARARQIPVMVTFAGGYARRVEDTIAIHSNTVIAAAEVFAGHGASSC